MQGQKCRLCLILKTYLVCLCCGVLVSSCGSDDTSADDAEMTSTDTLNTLGETDKEDQKSMPRSKTGLMVGTWEILSVNGKPMESSNPMSSIRFAFEKNGLYLRALKQVDNGEPYWGVDGGLWRLVGDTLIHTMMLPDSTQNEMRLIDVSIDRMTTQGVESDKLLIWKRSDDDIQSLRSN